MKQFKTMLALCLALLTVFSMFTFGASAEDAPETKSRFLVNEFGLYAIDLSDQIQDLSTINKGLLCLTDDEGRIHAYAKYDPDQTGVFLIGDLDENDVFTGDEFRFHGLNSTWILCADEEGNLYDGVPSFRFTEKEAYKNASDTVRVPLLYLSTEIGETDGDLIKTLTISIDPEWATEEYLLNSVDMRKEITLTVYEFGLMFHFRAVPVSFSNGTLTVALYDGDKEGVALHGLQFVFNDDVEYLDRNSESNRFELFVPEGMFQYGDCAVNMDWTEELSPSRIDDLPMRTVLEVHLPAGLVRLLNKLYNNPTFSNLINKAIVVLFFPHALRIAAKSLRSYGLDVNGIIRDALRSGSWKESLKDIFKIVFSRN